MNNLKNNIDEFFSTFGDIIRECDIPVKREQYPESRVCVGHTNKDVCIGHTNEAMVCRGHTNISTISPQISQVGEGAKTNIIYLTTRCNLDCTYCYERNKRNEPGFQHQDLTKEEIDTYIKDINRREGERNSSIVIMGGEPLLKIDLIDYLLEKCSEQSKSSGYSFNITTNGVLLSKPTWLNWFIEFKERCVDRNISLKLEISYDGSGQHLRQFPNGESSKLKVNQAIDKLCQRGIEFSVSYTTHEGNYQKVIPDVIRMINYWHPPLQKICVGFAFERLDMVLGPRGGFKLKEYLKPYAEAVYERYNYEVPICGLTCGYCTLCDIFDNGNSYLSPKKGILYKDKNTQTPFDQF